MNYGIVFIRMCSWQFPGSWGRYFVISKFEMILIKLNIKQMLVNSGQELPSKAAKIFKVNEL